MTKTYDPLAKTKATSFTVVPLSPELDRKWTETRIRFIHSAPAFSHILYTMMAPGTDKQLALFTRDVPIAATDGVNLLLNPDRFFEYTLAERVFVIAHEVMHCILDHCGLMHAFSQRDRVPFADGTTLPYSQELMNVATDLVINDMLIESQVGVFNKDWLHDKATATGSDSALDVYRKLYEEGGGGGGKGDGDGKARGKGFDQHLKPGSGQGKDPNQAQQDRNEQEWKTNVAAGMAAARAQGKLPAALERFFGDLLNPQVDWREHIRGIFARKVGSGSYDWRRPDRRLITRDEAIYAPGRSGNGAGDVVIGVDTSGSIDAKTLDMFFAEMAGLLEDVRPKRLVIIWCDAAVNRVDEAEEPSDLRVIRAKGAVGGGGTAFSPVFQEVTQMGITPDALVYLTDGLGSFPNEPTYPVIWGSIYAKPDHYPFGDVVMVPKQAEKR